MEILAPEQMAAKLDYARPLKPTEERADSLWCIPFEYGANDAGTRISIALAKTIAAELRMHVAEAERRQLLREFHREKNRGDDLGKRLADANTENARLHAEVADLSRRLRNKGRAKKRVAGAGRP